MIQTPKWQEKHFTSTSKISPCNSAHNFFLCVLISLTSFQETILWYNHYGENDLQAVGPFVYNWLKVLLWWTESARIHQTPHTKGTRNPRFICLSGQTKTGVINRQTDGGMAGQTMEKWSLEVSTCLCRWCICLNKTDMADTFVLCKEHFRPRGSFENWQTSLFHFTSFTTIRECQEWLVFW